MTGRNQSNPKEPFSRPEILSALAAAHTTAADFFRGMEPERFFRFPGVGKRAGWSAAENVRHLIKAEAAVMLAFRTPPLLPKLLFGRPRAKTRTLERLRQDYQARLSAGAGAGLYAPLRRGAPAPDRRAAERDRLVESWLRSGERLVRAVAPWSEENLDRVRFPHPFLGAIPARELLLFAVFHGDHHLSVVRRRLAEGVI